MENFSDALAQAAAHQQVGQWAHAESIYRQVLAAHPHHTPTYNDLGRTLYQLGRIAEAEAAFREAAHRAPGDPQGHFNLASLLQIAGKPHEACAEFRQALELEPQNSDAHNNLANVLRGLHRLAEAEDHYRHAVCIEPQFAEAWNNLGVVLTDQGRMREAVEAGQQATQLAPQFAEAHCNLVRPLWTLGEVDLAVDLARRAIALDPHMAGAHGNLGMCLQSRGQLDEAIEAYLAGMRADPNDHALHGSLIYTLNYHPRYDPQTLFAEHRQWGQRHADRLSAGISPHANDRDPARRLRIGYVSGHFRSHAVAVFVEPLLAAHRRANVEVFCYSNVDVSDEATARMKASAEHWREITGVGDDEVCALIRQDRIDILVDLAGHIKGNRLLVFARKPAPIQVTYLGYQNTTGMAAMDYRLTDEHADPPGLTDRYHTEKLVRLPRSFFCYLPDPAVPPVEPLPAAKAGYVTFGSFNNFSKVTPQVLATWAKLLHAAPGSRLVILLHLTPWLERYALDTMAQHGVEQQRITLAARRPHHEYLQLISQVDVALDAFPFNGHTTTCDCLWQGVPVVMLAGQTYVSRFGSSALVNLGLQDLVAGSPEQYVAVAARLAGDLSRLAELRANLRGMMTASPLLDGAGFTAHLEAAYRQIWTLWCRGQPS